jgi:hypothetical protein
MACYVGSLFPSYLALKLLLDFIITVIIFAFTFTLLITISIYAIVTILISP